MVRKTRSTVAGYVTCEQVELRGPTAKPFFCARLGITEAKKLLELLTRLAGSETRDWYYLVSSTPNLERLRLVDLDRTPAFERAAAQDYLRGELFRVSGGSDSCNIEFSAPVGARLLAERLRSTLTRARCHIQIVVPNRHGKKDLVELIADTDSAADDGDEFDRLGSAGEELAAQTLPAEDFSDWE